jgi:hypothetical protein
VRFTTGLLLALCLPAGVAAQEKECPGVRVGEIEYAQLAAKLRAAGASYREIPPDRDTGSGRGIFVRGAPLCPGFGRTAQGTVHYFVPGSLRLAVMIVNFRFSPEGHWAMEQWLDTRYDPAPEAPADPARPDVLAPQITKTWTREALVVRLRRDAPDVPPLYTGVEYRRPDLVAEMERGAAGAAPR